MKSHVYRAFDRLVASEYVLPGAVRQTNRSRAAKEHESITIVSGPARLNSISKQEGAYSLGEEGLLVEARDVAAYLCSHDGANIVVHALPGASPADVSTYLIANALPVALWLQDAHLLHAAAALLPSQEAAIVIAGPSRSGKSTILAELLGVGAAIVCEDVSCISLDDDTASVSGLPCQIQGRPDIATSYEDRIVQSVPERLQRASAPVSAVVVLTAGVDPKNHLPRRIYGAEALQALLQNRYRPVVASLADKAAADLQFWAKLAGRIPVYSWNSRHTERKDWPEILAGLGS